MAQRLGTHHKSQRGTLGWQLTASAESLVATLSKLSLSLQWGENTWYMWQSSKAAMSDAPTDTWAPSLVTSRLTWLPSWDAQPDNCWCLKHFLKGFPGGSDGKESTCNVGDPGSIGVRKIPWRREWQPTLVILPGECHGQTSLEGYSPWSCKESDKTERLTHLSLKYFCCCC